MSYARFFIPEEIKNLLRARFASELEPSRIKNLADSILRISDSFQQPGIRTPWNPTSLPAYLAYFLPLNYLRLQYLLREGQQLGFFNSIDQVIDFGSGPGTFHLASQTLSMAKNWNYLFIETDPLAIETHRRLMSEIAPKNQPNWQFAPSAPPDLRPSPNSLAVFSYSLTELSRLPSWVEACGALLVLEPSTQAQGRKLMQLRSDLISKGFSIWAPCTHLEACPLLSQSPRDWCHHRIHVDLPEWMMDLSRHLPMRNDTLTFSYLLASKATPPTPSEAIARVIGDTLIEKGKTRQAICRGPNREFLSWLDRDGEAQKIERGSRVEIPQDIRIISQELRPKGPLRRL